MGFTQLYFERAKQWIGLCAHIEFGSQTDFLESIPPQMESRTCTRRENIDEVQENLTADVSNLDHVKIAEGVSSEEKNKLMDMLCRHKECFSAIRGPTNLAEHRIETDGASPVHVRPHSVSLAERRVIQEQVKAMLADAPSCHQSVRGARQWC